MASLADEYHYGIDMNFIHWTYSAILQMVSLCGVCVVFTVVRGCAHGTPLEWKRICIYT